MQSICPQLLGMADREPSRMKLLLITSTFPTPIAPTQGVFNGLLVDALKKSHSVRVIAPIPWTSAILRQAFESNDENVQHPTFYYPPWILRWTYGFWYWKSIQRSFERMTLDYRPDAVLGYWAHPDGDAAVRAAYALKVPAVVMVGGSDVRILARTGKRRTAIQLVLKKANRIVAFSEDLAKHVSELGVPTSRIDVVYRGVDRSVFKTKDRHEARRAIHVAPDSTIVVWVGRLVEVKNPAMAIRSAVRWKQLWGKQFQLVMIGDGPMRTLLQRLANQLDINDHCTFLGAIPHAHIANWFQAANVTILTSHSEGVPNVLLESIACGTPFVATDVGGVREIADPSVDKLVPAGDEMALQEAVEAMVTDRTDNSRKPSAYDVDASASKIAGILERL
jgi:teichuronic acid biosynthesis glycosyltransferase TuaC